MIHFMTDLTRKNEGITTHTVDGYTTRKTILGAVHDIGKAIAKIEQAEGEILINAKTEAEAKQLLLKNMGADTYCFELEEVPCACQWDNEIDDMEYKEGHFYFMIRFFVYEDETAGTQAQEEETEESTQEATEATEDAYKIEQINATTWANIYGIYTRAGKPAGTVEIKLGGPEAGTYFYTLDSKHTKRDIKRIWTAYQKRAG